MCEPGYVPSIPEAGVTGSWVTWHGCWEPNLGRLDQQTLWTAEPSPQPCEHIWKLLSMDVCGFSWINIQFARSNVDTVWCWKGLTKLPLSYVAFPSYRGSPQMVFLWGIVMTYSDLNLNLAMTCKPILWEVFMYVVVSQLQISLWELYEFHTLCVCVLFGRHFLPDWGFMCTVQESSPDSLHAGQVAHHWLMAQACGLLKQGLPV